MIVTLYDQPIGTLAFAGSGRILFTVTPEYVDDPARPTLSQSFLSVGGGVRIPTATAASHLLPPYFENLLPEGRMEAYLRNTHQLPPFDQYALLGAIGRDLPGAVGVVADNEPVPTVDARRERAAIERSRKAQMAHAGEPLRFSLAGVQPKFGALLDSEHKGLVIPAAGIDGDWIVKLPSRAFPGLNAQEHQLAALARSVGIDVPETRLLPVSSIRGLPEVFKGTRDSAYAIRRYDRGEPGVRLHQEDLAQVLNLRPGAKYRTTYATIARALALITPEGDHERFWRMLTFAIATGNADLHAKNISLLYRDPCKASISPAYDLVATLAFMSDPGLALPLFKNGPQRWEVITLDAIAAVAERAGLSASVARRVVRETTRTITVALDGVELDGRVREVVARQFARVPMLRT